MPASDQPILPTLRVESLCRVDGKSRLTLPDALQPVAAGWDGKCKVVKERPGALSLWPADHVDQDIDAAISAALKKYEVRRNQNLLDELMTLGRLRSTRETVARLDGRARLTIPAAFRKFLGVEPEGQAMVIAATVCIEIWRPDAWREFVEQRIADYRTISEALLE